MSLWSDVPTDEIMAGLGRKMFASVSVSLGHLACLKKPCNTPEHESVRQGVCVREWRGEVNWNPLKNFFSNRSWERFNWLSFLRINHWCKVFEQINCISGCLCLKKIHICLGMWAEQYEGTTGFSVTSRKSKILKMQIHILVHVWIVFGISQIGTWLSQASGLLQQQHPKGKVNCLVVITKITFVGFVMKKKIFDFV